MAAGEAYYLACDAGHGTLPPRTRCPHCGGDLSVRPIPATGTVVARTVVRVPTTAFADAAPYVSAIADFGPVRLTGVVPGAPPDGAEAHAGAGGDAGAGDPAVPGDGVERGATVAPTVARLADDRRSLAFEVR
ncbi:MAG: nucleic acid-binding protein [Halobacteriaceae archaeon]